MVHTTTRNSHQQDDNLEGMRVTQRLETNENLQESQQVILMKRKCRGNRKLQRFKRKCRRHGLNEQPIVFLIERRNQLVSQPPPPNDHLITEQSKQSKKRKYVHSSKDNLQLLHRSPTQLSLSQVTLKRMKHSSTMESIDADSGTNDELDHGEIRFFKPSRYLEMPRKLLLRSMRLQLRCPLKKDDEQEFIFTRLTMLDGMYEKCRKKNCRRKKRTKRNGRRINVEK